MTKADIVNEISKNTGIEKALVLATVEQFMDSVKCVSERIRKLHCEKKSSENCKKYL